jgi:hypothetical protein
MHRPSGGLVRLATILAVAVALAACTAERPRLGPPVISPTKLGTLGPAPIKGAAAHFAFATVTSVPGEFVYALDDSLKSAAAARGLTLVGEDDPTTTYWVKGYLSAIGDVNGILLVYVWDVFDVSGSRLHRFSGQLPAPGEGADPWTGVTTAMIETAARETVDALADWVRG